MKTTTRRVTATPGLAAFGAAAAFTMIVAVGLMLHLAAAETGMQILGVMYAVFLWMMPSPVSGLMALLRADEDLSGE